jgi:SAM-dependent methyltransferase
VLLNLVKTGSRKLNIGCGEKRIPDALNIDFNPAVHPDIVHDLNKLPWPFERNSFVEVLAFDVMEHCDDVVRTMDEIHRVCSPDASVRITVPHFSCSNAYTDPTHRHFFGYESFDYVTGEHQFSFYTQRLFRRRLRQIVFYPTLLNRVVSRFANRWPRAYERRWAWMFPAFFLYFELEVVKEVEFQHRKASS